jgi:hypothetical protein
MPFCQVFLNIFTEHAISQTIPPGLTLENCRFGGVKFGRKCVPLGHISTLGKKRKFQHFVPFRVFPWALGRAFSVVVPLGKGTRFNKASPKIWHPFANDVCHFQLKQSRSK